jgi:hypothetical protein
LRKPTVVILLHPVAVLMHLGSWADSASDAYRALTFPPQGGSDSEGTAMPCPYTGRATAGNCRYEISQGRSPRPYVWLILFGFGIYFFSSLGKP